MAAGSAEGEGRNGGGSGNPARPITHSQAAYGSARAPAAALSHARDAEDDAHALVAAYEDALAYAHGQAYVSLAVKGSGLLALLLSTVILLGGYVQSLEKEDFFCITVITVIQAAGIFKDYYKSIVYFLDFGVTAFFLLGSAFLKDGCLGPLLFVVLVPVLYPVMIGMLCAELIYMFGPFACGAISSWRIAKLNHGNMDGTDSMVDMMAALNVFYSLIILQGAMFGVLLVTIIVGRRRVSASHLKKLELLSEEWWGKIAIHTYLYDISAKCRKDPLSTKGMDLIKHGVELLDSESQDDYLYGARILSAFINKGGDVRRLLLHSTDRIQRLIDSLWIGTGSLDESSAEIRELAATIVADLAGHIYVGRYPGAMRCISSLLQHQEETTRTYRCISDPNPQRRRPMGPLTKGKQGEDDQEGMADFFSLPSRDNMDLRRPPIAEKRQRRQKREGGTSNGNVVILQGLTILERLASNNDGNRRLIGGAPGLLAKITAPVYSATLIEDVKTNKAYADIVTRCLKVLYQLIRAPDGSHEIFSNNDRALSNLKSILLKLGNNDEAGHQELRLVVMKILTELSLVLDPSANLTEEIKKVLITEQLEVFLLANGHAAATAGRTLVSLSTNSASNSALIITTQNGTIGSVTGILDDKNNNITRRTIAAEIMANLFHCTVDVNNMKEILPKVLREIMSIKIKSQERQISAGQNNPASGDEENQGNSVSTNNEERHIIPWVHRLVRNLRRCLGLRVQQEGLTRTEENSNQEREEQAENSNQEKEEQAENSNQEREEQAEAFLSLAQVIFDKLESADLDSAIQSAVDQNNTGNEEQRREAFVDKLKTIIDDNCHPTADNLRIVKLCGQIAESTMGCQQYAKHFKNKDFKASLSKASKTMSELESCMFFVGTDFGPKKTVRPLFSKIEETWSEM